MVAGLDWGLNLVAFGLLIAQAIARSNSLYVFLLWWLLGSACVLVYRKLIDVVLLPEINLDDELELDAVEAAAGVVPNWGAALLVGAMTISLVQCLNTFLRDCEFEFVG